MNLSKILTMGIVVIGILEIVALEHGINGLMFKTAIGAISGICTILVINYKIEKRNKAK